MADTASDRMFICKWKDCNEQFDQEALLAEHDLLHRPYVCSFNGCTKSYATASSLTIHERVHTGERPYVCAHEGCTKSFTSSTVLNNHQVSHSTERNYKCDVEGCSNLRFKSAAILKNHTRLVHSDVRNYPCDHPDCKSAFKRSADLATHKRIHSGDKKYKCSFKDCTSAFTDSSALIAHERIHTNTRPFVCTIQGCTAAFNQSGALTVHMRNHLNDRRHRCHHDQCDAAFVEASSLQYHIRRHHTHERPFKCQYEGCEKAYVNSSELTIHMRMHLGIRPFVCDVCGAAFTVSGNRNLHKLIHTDEKSHRCQVEGCDAAFKYGESLKTHMYNWHTKEGQFLQKKDEGRIMRFLKKQGIEFKEQHMIDFVCLGSDRDGSRCFIDFLIICRDKDGKIVGFIFLEVDEHQHKGSNYSISCELRRMTDTLRSLLLEGNSYPIMFIRYNPHEFKVDGETKQMWLKDREAALLQYLQNVQFTQDFSVVYMYYDMIDGKPALFGNKEYAESFKSFVTECIY